jgi:hypothetical protein
LSETSPRIPAQRGPAKNLTAKTTKAPATFQPEYVNDSLELSEPKNGRPGKLSQYTKDLLVYVAALEKETIGLRDKQSTLDAKIIELNGTITELEQRITANSEQHQRKLAEAKNATRTANATMDAERTRADQAEANENVRQTVHDLFGGAALSELSTSRITESGGHSRATHFTCDGLRFTHRISSTRRSLTTWSALSNPIKLSEHVITRFAGNDLLVPDKTYLLFLREAATVEGYEQNKTRLNEKEMSQLYDMAQTNKVFACGHSVIRHVKMREELLQRFAPAIVSVVFQRLETSGDSTNDHRVELTRAIMISVGVNEDTANAWANDKVKENKQLDQAKQKLRSEGYNPELARALGASALSGAMDYEAIDLRPEDLRLKPKSIDSALRHIRDNDGPILFGSTPGLRYGEIKPFISEYNHGARFVRDPYENNLRDFPAGPTHDLGTDSLFDGPSGQPCVDGRPAAKDIKPDHSGECRNNGVTEGCKHPDHQPKG